MEPKYHHLFDRFCDYDYLRRRLEEEAVPGFEYRKLDGTWLKLQVMNVKTNREEDPETLWIFSCMDQGEEARED